MRAFLTRPSARFVSLSRFIGRRGMVAAVILPILTLTPVSAQPEVKRFLESAPAPRVAATQVGDVPLLWTGQIYGWAADGRISGQAQEQADAVVRHLRAALSAGESSFDLVVRINAYVTSDEVTPVLMAALTRAFAEKQPSITVVATPLAETGAVLAVDAVAAFAGGTNKVTLAPVPSFPQQFTGLALARVPAGRKVFISGQAEPASTLRQATRLDAIGGRFDVVSFIWEWTRARSFK
ncbi:MAG TPA: RidA family protein [Opitutaceae bacterium]|nr:RidA family protein [Opitutaceae bacterium]